LLTLNVPKPTSLTSFPPPKEEVTDAKVASIAFAASALERLVLEATDATRSFLFTLFPPLNGTEYEEQYGSPGTAAWPIPKIDKLYKMGSLVRRKQPRQSRKWLYP
jgi:hypothetical protein